MLVQDAMAFIEQIDVLLDHEHTSKHRRRLARAKIEVLEARREVQFAAAVLQEMEERARAQVIESPSVSGKRQFLRSRSVGSLEREIATVRAHLEAKRDQLAAKQKCLIRVEQRPEHDRTRRSARMFRLHSTGHHVDCSAARFARLSALQLERAVPVTKKEGSCWWWYLDRFWWDDEGLSAADIEMIVLRSDLQRKLQSDGVEQKRAMVLGDAGLPFPEEQVSESVRLAVWYRDHGRCVDCGSGERIVFDHLVPISQGGSDTTANVELRCKRCCIRLYALDEPTSA